MMLTRILAVFFYLGIGILASFAGPCDAIITHGLRNISVGYSEEALVANKYAKACGYDFSSLSDQQMANLEVEVTGYGGGSAGYSRSRIEQAIKSWCSENRSTAQHNQKDLQQSQVFYQGAVDAWQSCIALNSRDVLISPRISGDARTVDIAIQYRGLPSADAVLSGVKSNGFDCKVTLPDGSEAKYPVKLTNSSVNINCERKAASLRKLGSNEYDYLTRGTISVQTASDPFQLFFVEEYVPLAPDTLVAELTSRLARNELPVGTIITSTLPPDQFLASSGPYDVSKWVPASGGALPVASLYGKLSGVDSVPDLRFLQDAKYLTGVVSQSIAHGGQVASLIPPELSSDTWTWLASLRDISGSRVNNDYEQDVDNFQVLIDNGAVTAMGRTLNWKHGAWGPWNGGSANVLGFSTRPSKLYYYVKIN